MWNDVAGNAIAPRVHAHCFMGLKKMPDFAFLRGQSRSVQKDLAMYVRALMNVVAESVQGTRLRETTDAAVLVNAFRIAVR